jgi:hypothetical protein
MEMPFGKRAGKHPDEVPAPYLLWVLRARRGISPVLHQAICASLRRRGFLAGDAGPGAWQPPQPDWEALIRRWYRDLVKDFHPDRGGSHEAMKAIAQAHARLRRLVGLADG